MPMLSIILLEEVYSLLYASKYPKVVMIHELRREYYEHTFVLSKNHMCDRINTQLCINSFKNRQCGREDSAK